MKRRTFIAAASAGAGGVISITGQGCSSVVKMSHAPNQKLVKKDSGEKAGMKLW